MAASIMDRLRPLIEKLESGEPPTEQEVRRAETLMALDAVVAGEEFVQESLRRQREADDASL